MGRRKNGGKKAYKKGLLGTLWLKTAIKKRKGKRKGPSSDFHRKLFLPSRRGGRWPSWCSARPGFASPACRQPDAGEEPRIAQCLPRSGGHADVVDRIGVRFRAQQRAVGRQTQGRGAVQRGIQRMRCRQQMHMVGHFAARRRWPWGLRPANGDTCGSRPRQRSAPRGCGRAGLYAVGIRQDACGDGGAWAGV